MTEKLPKIATVELDDDLRIVLAHMCEDMHLEPGTAINRLCNHQMIERLKRFEV